MYGGLGQYGDELRRQRRLEAIVVNQMVSPASSFARRHRRLSDGLSLDTSNRTTCQSSTGQALKRRVVSTVQGLARASSHQQALHLVPAALS